MTQEEIKKYLKNNLKIAWTRDKSRNKLYIALILDNEIISKMPFAQD